jgi:hypothetical protein
MLGMEGVRPERVVHWESSEDNQDHVVYLWTAPLQTVEPE